MQRGFSVAWPGHHISFKEGCGNTSHQEISTSLGSPLSFPYFVNSLFGLPVNFLSMAQNDSKSDHFSNEMFALGLKNRRKVVGSAYVDTALKNGSTEFAYPNQQLVTE